jgi:hypothetical protein
LFLERDEADTLGKMIDYILGEIAKGSLKIRPESKERLEAIRPRMWAVFPEDARSEAGDG